MSPIPQAARADVGPMISGYAIEAAVELTLRNWLTAYLCEAERQHGLEAGLTAWPRGWAHIGSDLQKYAQDQLPCVVIMAGGIVDRPVYRAMPAAIGRIAVPRGNMTAVFRVEVAVILGAAYDRTARRSSQLYAVALRSCLQQRPLDVPDEFTFELAAEIRERGEEYDLLDFERTRTYAAADVRLDISVDNVGLTDGGPPPEATHPVDPTDPWEPWAQVSRTDVEVDKRPLDESPITEETQ